MNDFGDDDYEGTYKTGDGSRRGKNSGRFGEKRCKTKKKKPAAHADHVFDKLCQAHGLPVPVQEFEFAKEIGRKWRLDFVWDGWLALEVNGGVWVQGRHTRGQGFIRDMEKLNEAQLMGYVVLQCTPADVESGAAFALVKRALDTRDEVT